MSEPINIHDLPTITPRDGTGITVTTNGPTGNARVLVMAPDQTITRNVDWFTFNLSREQAITLAHALLERAFTPSEAI